MQDGTPTTPNELVIKIGQGTITHDEKRKMEYILDRGRLSTVREGDEEPMDVKLDLLWEFLTAVTSSGIPTPEEALKKTGEASGWLTSSSDPCEPYAINVIIKYDPPCASISGETITFHDFRWESLAHDPKAGTVVCTGKCNHKTATVARRSNTYTP